MAIIKKQIGNELYVYMNGALLYKRWLNQGHGMVMQGGAWGNFRASDVFQHITDKQKQHDKDLVNK